MNKHLICVTMIASGLFMTGCLENGGSTEVSPNHNNGDFSVITEPAPAPGSGAGAGNGDSANAVIPTPAPVSNTLGGFDLNAGRTITNSSLLSLTFYPPFSSSEILISESLDCSGTDWVPFADQLDYQSSKKDQAVAISVQYQDYDGRRSPCYQRSIYIDEAGPEILFSKYPAGSVEEGLDVEIVFNVTDPGAGVNQVTCQFAGFTKTCGAGENKVLFPNMAGGTYALTVQATDNFGYTSTRSISFSVTSLYRSMAKNVKVNAGQKVDILFVIDNSGSMQYEQQSMASRVRNFLDVVKGLDWQIAVTTTDPDDKPLGDGRLVPLYGKTGSYILTSATPDLEARNTLSMTLQRPETGSGAEQGIKAAYRAVERSMASVGGNTNFIRSDAQLAVVVISDEDESANGSKNDPTNFVNFIQSSFAGQKAMTFHSIIARPGDQACLSGEGFSAGYRYEQISKLTGGVIGDVCATDYSAQLQGIAEGVRNTLKSISLSCAPVIDARRSVSVMKDGVAYSGAWTLQGLNLVFDQMLPAGQYEVLYSCLK